MTDTKTTYSDDDRGNVVDFYNTATDDFVARLNREATVDGDPDRTTWDGDDDVTAWAIANGYADAIRDAVRVSNAETAAKNLSDKAFVAAREAARVSHAKRTQN